MSDAIAFLLFIAVAVGGGMVVGCSITNNRWTEEAISHGYASYEIVDQKTGKTEFKWK